MNIYIDCDLKSNLNNFDRTLKNCLFGAVKLTKNSDIDKYKYSGHGIGFDSKGTFSHLSGGIGQNIVIFGAERSSYAHANNKTKNILIHPFLQKRCIQLIFTASKRKFCLSLHYNGTNSYLFVNGTEIIKFKAKDSEIVANVLSRKHFRRFFCS